MKKTTITCDICGEEIKGEPKRCYDTDGRDLCDKCLKSLTIEKTEARAKIKEIQDKSQEEIDNIVKSFRKKWGSLLSIDEAKYVPTHGSNAHPANKEQKEEVKVVAVPISSLLSYFFGRE